MSATKEFIMDVSIAMHKQGLINESVCDMADRIQPIWSAYYRMTHDNFPKNGVRWLKLQWLYASIDDQTNTVWENMLWYEQHRQQLNAVIN